MSLCGKVSTQSHFQRLIFIVLHARLPGTKFKKMFKLILKKTQNSISTIGMETLNRQAIVKTKNAKLFLFFFLILQ